MLFTVFKYLFLFVPEILKFLKYAKCQVMTSYTQPNFDQGYLSQFLTEMFDFLL